MGQRFRLAGGVLWVLSGMVVLVGALLVLRECAKVEISEEAVASGPAVRVVRKCKPPEKGWCVMDLGQMDEPVPERCECGPMPKEYAALLEPDRSWETLKEYRRSLRREARKR